MNKAPQPITGPPTAPSPGLSQPSYPPGQPSVVFATPPPQMNPTPQPRQFAPGPRPIHQQGGFRSLQPYYTNRANLPPSSGPRGVPPSSGPRPVAPTHVYQPGPGSQMMMIPQQQLPFPSSPQGAAYFIPGQYRSATYVATPQQYPVQAGTPGFYPGTSPAEYGTYAGAYYPAQAQFTPQVQPAPVIMNAAPQQQQQQPPPQHIATKRERKQIRIRDPNQGGRDITEEIMSGGRSGSTPTPPQAGSESTTVTQANGEKVTPALVRPDDRGKPTPPPLSKTPELIKREPLPKESPPSDTDTKTPPPSSLPLDNPLNTTPTPPPSAPVAEVMDAPPAPREQSPTRPSAPEVPAYPAPLPDPVPTSAAKNRTENEPEQEVTGKESEAEAEPASSDAVLAPPSTTNGVSEVEPARLSVTLPSSSQMEAPLESPIAQPEELRLPNGLPLPAPQDPEAPATSTAERDDSPIAEPDVNEKLDVLTPAPPAQAALAPVVQAVPSPLSQATPSPVVKATPSPYVKATPSPYVKATPSPYVKATPSPYVKATPSPVVKATPSPVVKATPSPVVKATPSPFVPATLSPVVKATPSPVVKTTPSPFVKATPSPVVPATPLPVVEATPSPVVDATPSPVVEATPSPVVEATPSPLVEATPSPVVEATPSPVVEATPSPVVEATPSPVVEATPSTPSPVVEATPSTPSPVVEATPSTSSPVVEATPSTSSPVVEATPSTPSLVVEATPAPIAQATRVVPAVLAPTVQPEMPTPPHVPETVAPVTQVAPNTKTETPTPVAKVETPAPVEAAAAVTPEAAPTPPPPTAEEREDTPPPSTATPAPEETMQAAVSVPKKKRKMKDLNNKGAVGDLLDAFTEDQVDDTPPEPEPVPAPEAQAPAAPPAAEEADLTWEDKEDKLDAENIKPGATDKKYQYKTEQWQPLDPEDKKKYDREFLLGFQFISASMNKPEGLPAISDVVLDKANKTPLRQLDPSRLPGMNCGPDFTPSYANLGRSGMGGGGRGPGSYLLEKPPGMTPINLQSVGPRRSQQGQRKEPRKIIMISSSMTEDVQLNKAEKAWKPSGKTPKPVKGPEEAEDDTEEGKTQELFKRVRSVLNKLTPQMFQQLMKQVTELTIDTEERLKGVIDLIFEKAISEPNFSVAYANMCRCLMGLKVPTTGDKPGVVNFRKLLLNRCQKEFEKDKDDDEIFEKKQKELDAAPGEEKQRLKEELDYSKDQARRRSLGNIKFIGELFKLKMLTEVIMHDCIVKLLKNHDEESLECLCRLFATIGKDLDFEKAKPRMDQYFHQMEKIIKEKKTSSRIRFMLQDVLDLRRNNWVPRRADQGPKTIDQIHKDAEIEEHREQMKVQQALMSKPIGGSGGRMGGGGPGGRGPHPQGRSQPQDEGWNTVPISTKNRPIDTSRLSKITKTPILDFNSQLLAPGGKGTWGSWGKGSSGGTTATKPAAEPGPVPESGNRPATSTLNRFSALQQPTSGSSQESDRRVPQRNSSSRERGDRFDRFDRRDDRRDDRNRLTVTKRSFSREKENSRERDHRGPVDAVRRVASMTDDRERDRDRGSRDRDRDRARSKENVKREAAPTPPPQRPQTPTKPALTEEELEKKSTAIIEEYLHINDMKEALQCVQEMNSAQLLFVFVRNGMESTLERSAIVREHMGLLLHQLIKTGMMPTQQYYKGLQEILEVAEDMAIDIPLFWLYLAELITPMLHEGGIPMGQLFKEISKPLAPMGKAGDLLVHILILLCKGMSHIKVGAMWREAGLSWNDFLPEDEDVNKFVTEKNVEFTLGDESEKDQKKEVSPTEMSKQLDRLIQDKADNTRIFDWIEANLEEEQTSSNTFVRALMTSICQAAIICENPYKVDSEKINHRAKLLQKYLKDEQKELQALYALQALMVEMEQPANLLRMFFDTLYDEDVIKEEAFYKWEVSKDTAEQQGKGVALKSVTAFFTWLREAEDESDNS